MPDPGRRFAAPMTLLALGALVSLVAHQLAYVVAEPLVAVAPALEHASHGHLDHSHLSFQFALVVPLAAIAAAVVIIRWARRLGLGTGLRAHQLGAVGGLLFVGQEAAEAISQTGGLGAMVANPATFVGAVLAPIVAYLAILLLRQASAVVARILGSSHPSAFPTVGKLPHPSDGVDMGRVGPGARLARGPPRLVLLTDL
ncbi:MAG: hypothetical protein ACR2QO_14555 [Acidimicrobiales bacterium]